MVRTRSIKKADTVASQNAVLDTAELLEQILFRLPTKDLLLAQRVSKTWRTAIKKSTRLQQALFLVPIAKARLDYETVVDPSSSDRCMAVGVMTGKPVKTVIFNPLIQLRGGQPPGAMERAMYTFNAQRRSKWNEPVASFKDMLLCQPALTSITASWYLVGWETRVTNYHVLLSNGNGVTVGDVYNTIKASIAPGNLALAAARVRVELYKSLGLSRPTILDDNEQLEQLKLELRH